ncbi:MAG: hypothetical protein QXK37_02225 [Candidatus Woesearchaeota archaeon]
MKRGDLSLTTIIIAAICLIVFVVLVLIFTGKIKVFNEGLKDCKTKNGEPKEYDPSMGPQKACGDNAAVMFTYTEEKKQWACCLPLTK